MSLVFKASYADDANLTTYTFQDADFGDAAADRYIIVAVHARDADPGDKVISSVTIGGQAATIVKQENHIDTDVDIAGLAIAAVPDGATGDVVVVFSTSMLRAAIGVYRVDNLNSATPTDTGSSTAHPLTADLDIPANGFAIAVANAAHPPTGEDWTGLTEDYGAVVEVAFRYSGASDELEEEEAGRTITCTFSGSVVEPVGVFASWAFAPVTVGRSHGYIFSILLLLSPFLLLLKNLKNLWLSMLYEKISILQCK